MNIKRFIAIILTAVTCIMCIPVTASAATTTDLGYKIVNSTAKRDFTSEISVHRGIEGHGLLMTKMERIVYISGDDALDYEGVGIYSRICRFHVNQDTVNLGICGYSVVHALYNNDYDFKCYFKAAKENKWHRYKNYVKITKPGDYQVKYTWREDGELKQEVINFTVHKWVHIEVFQHMNYETMADRVIFGLCTLDVPEGAKYYYTTNGKKPTTKSKQAAVVNGGGSKHNEFTFTESCTFRMLITCPGYENTYITIPVCIGKEYANSLLWLNDDEDVEAYVTAATGVYNRPQCVKFCRGYGRPYKFYYTTDGSKPTTKSATISNYDGYVDIDKTCTLRVLTIDKDGNKQYSRFKYIIDRNSAVRFFYID